MKIAYLMNQYPYPSCTFIRREIAELEACGISISRFSIRYPDLPIKDDADRLELAKTRFILTESPFKLLFSMLWSFLTRPLAFWRTLQLTFKIGWKSDRGTIVNLVYFAEACLLLRWLLKLQVEHVHAHFASNPAAVALLCHSLGGPQYSFTVHGPNEFDRPQAISLPEKIRQAAFVLGISSFTKSQLFRWCDYTNWAKIHIVHCGVDKLFLNQPFVQLPQEPCFVCVGRLSEQKGHLILVEAANQLALEGLQFKIVLVGDGPFRQKIEDLIVQFHLENYIEITGWATNLEVQQHILKAQVMVLPSFAEGLPVGIMEAFALSRPVISTYIAGIPELVEPGVCGWLVPSGSIEALANAMRSAIDTPVERLTEMGKAGYQRVLKDYSITTETQKLLALFEKYYPSISVEKN